MALPKDRLIIENDASMLMMRRSGVPGATMLKSFPEQQVTPDKLIGIPKEDEKTLSISPFSLLVDAFWLMVFAIGSIIEGFFISITVATFITIMFFVSIIATVLQSIALIFFVHIAVILIAIVLGIVVVSVAIMACFAPSE